MPYRRKTEPRERPAPEIRPVFSLVARRVQGPEETEPPIVENDERPRDPGPCHGRWWTRTTDLFLIREAL